MPTSVHRVADRYDLLAEMPRAGGAVLYRARDLAFGEVVALKQLGQGPSALRGLEMEVRRVQRSPHLSFVRLYQLDVYEGILVREWIHGFSLLDLIRRHRELPAAFALRLLDQLPAILDIVAARSLPLPSSLLAKLLVRFDDDQKPETIVTQPIASWPAFSLKLNLVSVRASIPEMDAENTAMTTIGDPRQAAGPELPPPTRLASLLYEILGGPMRGPRDRRYTPLPALREEGNGVLRRALLETPYRDCRTLWADLMHAEPSKTGPTTPLPAPIPPLDPPWLCPAKLAAAPEPGAVLKIVPTNPAVPGIHIVAKPKFKIGRSIYHADLITRFLPENASNDDLTNQLSRVHALATSSGGRLLVRDGNGESPSVNGTVLDDDPLEAGNPAPLRNRCVLTLGGVYSVEIVPLVTPTTPPLRVKGAETAPAAGQQGLGGAVYFLPLSRQASVRHAVWIFSQAGFGLDGAQRIVWDTRDLGGSPASFFYERGCFWLANRALEGGHLTVGGIPLAPGEIAPLGKGQELRIAAQAFTIDIV